MEYSKMVRQAVSSGEGEEAMWKSVARVDSLLEDIKEENPDMYWKFLREAHEDLYGMHYTPEYAEYDLSRLHYTDGEGVKRTGAHWSLKDVLAVTANKPFPEGTTDCDKWVAYNAAYADFCRRFSDNEILDIAYLFYFDDEDFEGEGKIWRYMSAMR